MGEANVVPLEGAGIGFALPAGFEADIVERISLAFKFFGLLFYLFGGVEALGALREAQSPARRQVAASTEEVITAHSVHRRRSGKEVDFNAFGGH